VFLRANISAFQTDEIARNLFSALFLVVTVILFTFYADHQRRLATCFSAKTRTNAKQPLSRAPIKPNCV